MRNKIALLLTLALSIVAIAAFAADSSKPAEAKPAGYLTKVEPKTVCMINEQAMGRDQIPVEVEGKTYFGCCQMCVTRLTNDEKTRVAIDPVSGKEVDKAKAVIAAQEDGRVFYFENEENLAKYNGAL